jgi:hypothetical protein
VYWAIEEIGHSVLCRSNAWFTFGVLRTALVKQVPGGIGCLTKLILLRFFGTIDNMSGSGVMLQIRGTHVIMFAEMGRIVADEDAIREMWHDKGSSGMKPCFKCRNVTSLNTK